MKTKHSDKHKIITRAAALLLAFVVVVTFTGCYGYNGRDYAGSASDFNDLSYKRPAYDRFYDLYDHVMKKSDSFFDAVSLRNSFLEMYSIYIDVTAMGGLLDLYRNLDVTNTYYADEAVTLAAKSVDIYDKLWEACDVLVHGSGGWLLRSMDGLAELLEDLGGKYSNKKESDREIDALRIEIAMLLDEYQRLLNLEYSVDGDRFEYLYEIPDKAKSLVENDDGSVTWIISEQEIYVLSGQGYISDETAYLMLQDIERQKTEDFGECFIELVKKRNEIARISDPDSDYYKYSYLNDYHRDFAPEDVAGVRGYVSKPLVNLFFEAAGKISEPLLDRANELYAADFYNGILDNAKPILEDISTDLSDMLESMIKTHYYDIEYRPEKIDLGFTAFLPVYEKNFLYLQPQETATGSDISSFFHEFGHYFHQTRVPEAAFAGDIDTAEVMSQALELMVSKYYGRIYPDADAAASEYNYLVIRIVQSIILSFLFDEFEERVYKEEPSTPAGVSAILGGLLEEYGLSKESFSENIWINLYQLYAYPGYYISYGVSAIAAINIFLSEDQIGNYLSFCDATADAEGIRAAAKAAGIDDPFDRDLFAGSCGKLLKTLIDIT